MAPPSFVVSVSPTRRWVTSLTPVITYPTSPARSSSVLVIAGVKKPMSSMSDSVPATIARIASPLRKTPSTTRMKAITPRYWSNSESKISARAGASGSPDGAGTRLISSSSTSITPSPVFPEIARIPSADSPSSSLTSAATRSGSAPGRSILFRHGISSRPESIARYVFASVCASTPCEASTTSSAPSQAASDRLTSYVKSTCPGVSIRCSW